MIPIIIWIIALFFLTIIHLISVKNLRNLKGVLESLLLYMFLINVALASLWTFFGYVFFADEAAKFMGFGPGSPFQYEVGIANLAFGVMGIFCVWERGDFWLATAIGYSPGNSGAILWFHLIFPLLLLSILTLYRYLVHHHKKSL
ncbi:MAG: hypothetical protein NTY13_01815 [Chlamydiae bacterium]|nr:hypothetical protein [Chlamydiota bacterium]